MKSFLVIFLTAASVSSGAEWDAFQVTYAPRNSGKGYYDMPWTVKEATANGKWIKIDEDKSLNVDVYSQPNDPHVLILFDKNGNCAGIRTAYLKDEVGLKAKSKGLTFPFEFDNNPMFTKGKYFGKDLWYSGVLFQSPAKLASGGRKKGLNKNTDDIAEGVYFKNDGKWTELSEEECKPPKDFDPANCFDGMGKHYFYKNNARTECKHSQPFFTLYHEGKLLGFGLYSFGSFVKNPKTQNYLEEFPEGAIRSINPNAPKCMEEFINNYGMTVMHVYMRQGASKLTCPPKDWKSTHC